MRGPRDLDKVRAELRTAGYNGEKIVIINPTDFPTIGPFGQVTADLLRRLGMNVELVETDWGSVVQRRASKAAPDAGGWSIFHTWWPSVSIINPAVNATLRGQGERGWFGWYANPRVEDAAAQWLQASTEAEQKRLAEADPARILRERAGPAARPVLHRHGLSQRAVRLRAGQRALSVEHQARVRGARRGPLRPPNLSPAADPPMLSTVEPRGASPSGTPKASWARHPS